MSPSCVRALPTIPRACALELGKLERLGEGERLARNGDPPLRLVGDDEHTREIEQHLGLRPRRPDARDELDRPLDVGEGLILLALVVGEEPEQRFRLCGGAVIAQLPECVAGLFELLGALRLRVVERLPQPEDERGPLWIVVRPELDGLPEEAGRRWKRVEREGPVAGVSKCVPSAVGKLRCLGAGGAAELERTEVMVREHLRSVDGSVGAQRLEPLGRSAMDRAAAVARNLAVGDVANENVAEAILVFVLDRRAPDAREELLSLEDAELALDPLPRAAADDGKRPGPDDPSDNGGLLEQLFLLGREEVEARSDDAVDRLGERKPLGCALLAPAGVGQHPHVLDGVQRIA